MSSLSSANLIRLFDFYLAMMFLMSFVRRYTLYWNVLRLLISVRGRWPKLLERMKYNHQTLITKDVIRPLLLATGLMVIQFFCSRLIFPEALVTVSEIFSDYLPATLLLIATLPMIAVDLYFITNVGRFDRSETEKYMDQAESWLSGWKGKAIRTVTVGYVNPQKIVERELQKSLVSIGKTVSWAAWWVSIQVCCRTACGLTIWLLWAFRDRLS